MAQGLRIRWAAAGQASVGSKLLCSKGLRVAELFSGEASVELGNTHRKSAYFCPSYVGSIHPVILICSLLCLPGAISYLVTTLNVMICSVCKNGLEGMWDPSRSRRLALLKDFLGEDVSSVIDPSQYEHFRRRY